MQAGKISKIDKHAGWNKAMQDGIFQKINKICCMIIRETRVHEIPPLTRFSPNTVFLGAQKTVLDEDPLPIQVKISVFFSIIFPNPRVPQNHLGKELTEKYFYMIMIFTHMHHLSTTVHT